MANYDINLVEGDFNIVDGDLELCPQIITQMNVCISAYNCPYEYNKYTSQLYTYLADPGSINATGAVTTNTTTNVVKDALSGLLRSGDISDLSINVTLVGTDYINIKTTSTSQSSSQITTNWTNY